MRTFGSDTLCELTGQTLNDEELAERFGISRKTLRAWKRRYPNFAEAVRLCSEGADFEVISSIFKRAVGYKLTLPKTYKLKRVEYDPVTGKKLREYEELSVVLEEEYVAGDLRAAEFWLRARQGQAWGGEASSNGDDHEVGVVEIPEAARAQS